MAQTILPPKFRAVWFVQETSQLPQHDFITIEVFLNFIFKNVLDNFQVSVMQPCFLMLEFLHFPFPQT